MSGSPTESDGKAQDLNGLAETNRLLLAETARLRARIAELEFVVRCPECGGKGERTFDFLRNGNEHDTATVECPACRGTGTCQDMISEVARLRAERLAEDAVVEAARVVSRSSLLYGLPDSRAASLHDAIYKLDALRAARAGKDGG